ncbi:phasin family protein [Salisaeta longa]|uniref:phasin family protein n=1 Tax=Salisaeta longa TaxID=503170 RepID=UPI000414AE39|nr:phasin family protein [Salisaeta longa]
MSDEQKPSINITRGTRGKKSSRASSKHNGSSGAGLGDVAASAASGAARTAQNVWLAGLGTLSVAEEWSGKIFDALVEEGRSWEQTRRARTSDAKQRLEQTETELADAASAFEQRMRTEVNGALERLGVPSQSDVEALREQVQSLNAKVERMADALDARTDDTSS